MGGYILKNGKCNINGTNYAINVVPPTYSLQFDTDWRPSDSSGGMCLGVTPNSTGIRYAKRGDSSDYYRIYNVEYITIDYNALYSLDLTVREVNGPHFTNVKEVYKISGKSFSFKYYLRGNVLRLDQGFQIGGEVGWIDIYYYV